MNTNNRLKVGTIALFIIMFIFIAFTNSQAAPVSTKTTTPKTTKPTTTTPTTTTSGTNVYYIDYVRGSDSNAGSSAKPWKLCPGMKGFVGKYTHQAGDTFIFKSSVTWPSSVLPLTITYSGSSGKIDTYKGDSTTMKPVFDGGGIVNSLAIASGKSYFKIDGIKMINAGLPRTANSKYALDIGNCQYFTISNCILQPETWLGIFVYATKSGTFSTININNNDISGAAMGIVIATAAANSIIDNVIISGNKIHDFTSQIGGTVHGDGIHIWSSPNTDITQYTSNLKIYNNSFYGSFASSFGTTAGVTAFIYIEGPTKGVEIYKNNMGYTDKPTTENIFASMIYIKGEPSRGGSHNIHDNIAIGTNPGMSAAITLVNAPNTTIKNNIFSGMQYVYNINTASITGATINHNTANYTDQYNTVGVWGSEFAIWKRWQALGNDINGTNQKP